MNKINERSFYFKGLAAWANGVSRLIDEDRLDTLAKEFNHDARAHAAKLIDEAELLFQPQSNSDTPPQLNKHDVR